MMSNKSFIGIIPARYASTRFPGKPLAILGDKPVIQHVYEQGKKALERIVVATDDERIYDAVRRFGGEVVMTRSDHKCGTDRCLEAYEKVAGGLEDIIINIQGDEPFIQPQQIEALKACFDHEDTQIATLVHPFTDQNTLAELENPNSPKVVFSPSMKALMFSRSVIPYLRGVDKSEWLKCGSYYKHIGMYAYKADILKQITQLEQTPLEKAESLEQLRWLENGYTIRVGITHHSSIGIDTPEDLVKANELWKNNRNNIQL